MPNADISRATVQTCNFSAAKLPPKGPKWSQTKVNGGIVPMKQLGFACAETKAMGMVQGLKQAGYSCSEAKQA
eukprot:1552211-Prymnesium_polylepis.1